jgi:hypothetical protein
VLLAWPVSSYYEESEKEAPQVRVKRTEKEREKGRKWKRMGTIKFDS